MKVINKIISLPFYGGPKELVSLLNVRDYAACPSNSYKTR